MPVAITHKLIDDCRAGHRRAQRELYNLTLPYLSAVAGRYLVRQDQLEDTLQVVYLKIFTKLDQFDASRGSFLAWASRITVHRCLKQNAQHRRSATSELPVAGCGEPYRPAAVLADLSHRELIEWLRCMPAPLYEVFNLFVIDGFTHAEIGELLGITVDLSRQRLTRARAWIRQYLPTHMGPEGLTDAGDCKTAPGGLVPLIFVLLPAAKGLHLIQTFHL